MPSPRNTILIRFKGVEVIITLRPAWQGDKTKYGSSKNLMVELDENFDKKNRL
jgi:hypothetical protein